jgi:hypothetical protein
MPLYRIQSTKTGWFYPDTEATTPEEACKKLGLNIGDSKIREYTTSRINSDSGTSGGGWKNITPRKERNGK